MSRCLRSLSLAVLVSLAFLPACESVPGTGRNRLMLVPISTDLSLGAEGYQHTLAESKIVSSGPEAEMVQRVGSKISAAAERLYFDEASQFEWEIVLIDEPQTANAWCMPGGKMAVYTGLLPITGDEQSLAVVVGHEVCHAVARHGAERMSHELVMELGLTAASLSMSDMDSGERDQIMQALVGVGTVGAILPFSREHEAEADYMGLMVAADAGYDPQAAIGLWERMAKASAGNAPPELLSTHPSDASRIEHLKEVMPEAMGYYEQAKRAGR